MSGNAETFTLLSLVVAIILLRIVVRLRSVGLRGLHLDDYLMPLAGILCIIDFVAAIYVVIKANGLTNSYMTDEERAALSPDSEEYAHRVIGSKIQVFGWTLYAASLWCIKACVAIFYSRLTANLARLQIRVYIAYAFIGATWVLTTCLLLFGCWPMSKYWQINPDPGICQPTNSKLYVLSVLIPDVLTDIYLLSIPVPVCHITHSLPVPSVADTNSDQLLWAVNISFKKKVSLIFLFSGVIFVIAAAIIRGVVILNSGPEGAVSGSEWAVREEFVSIAVSNLPILYSPIRSFCNKIGLSALFSTHNTNNKTPFEGRTIGGGGGGSGYPLRKPNKDPHGTVPAWGSDEQILCENGIQNPARDIVVAREVAVESEAGSVKGPPGSSWAASAASGWNTGPTSRG
ncbi:hypothetical protein CHGG_00131 [Chaetomium globosum CBS 148.51]|uniref:Rhodopsin domain-containing protein n=1 Tax=Chaetomium globosum (strain ATCC 6205 / CBS 148.51 / DSM 1962 / NBRC 6347 / NRRL 1970) TaxID=306901 RepID=Q2HI23_CHAGB|nr:uncharacterized protein CHGG_00131 [Chaetomium globosum CBS 148.51]EAQ91896.1 hypothetical protein CHGG_00131 [Chaetomium globosum CBS 148.51]